MDSNTSIPPHHTSPNNHWIVRLSIRVPDQDIPVIHEYGPYALKEEAIHKAVTIRDTDYSDYFMTNDNILKKKWHDEGPPFYSVDVDPYPDLDDNQIEISVRDISRPSQYRQRRGHHQVYSPPKDDFHDEIHSDFSTHTGWESTPVPYENWIEDANGDFSRKLDGWITVVTLNDKHTVFGPYATEVQATRMKNKLMAVTDKDATIDVHHEGHFTS